MEHTFRSNKNKMDSRRSNLMAIPKAQTQNESNRELKNLFNDRLTEVPYPDKKTEPFISQETDMNRMIQEIRLEKVDNNSVYSIELEGNKKVMHSKNYSPNYVRELNPKIEKLEAIKLNESAHVDAEDYNIWYESIEDFERENMQTQGKNSNYKSDKSSRLDKQPDGSGRVLPALFSPNSKNQTLRSEKPIIAVKSPIQVKSQKNLKVKKDKGCCFPLFS